MLAACAVDTADKHRTLVGVPRRQSSEADARRPLDRGATVDHADHDGTTPLFQACQNRCYVVARLLLDRGAAVDLAANGIGSPLCVACEGGHVAVVRLEDPTRLLLNHGAAVDCRCAAVELRYAAVHGRATGSHGCGAPPV